jgi:hypothetical protein
MNRYLLPIAFLMLGVGVGAAAFRTPATAQEKADKPVAKWEYKVSSIDLRVDNAETRLNDLASRGWEAVMLDTHGFIVFKRPKTE